MSSVIGDVNGGAVKLRRLPTLAVVAGLLMTPDLARTQTKGEAYLSRAQELLASVPAASDKNVKVVESDDKDDQKSAAEKISDLRKHFEELATEYRTSRQATGHEGDWKMKFSEVERDLAKIIGGGTSSRSTTVVASLEARSSEPTAVGTTGVAADSRPPSSTTVPPATTQGAVIVGSPTPAGTPAPAVSGSTPGSAVRGVEPTVTGSLGVGEPAQPGAVAAVPAPGTAAASGADATPGTAAVLTVAPSTAASAADPGSTADPGAAKVSMIGIEDLNPAVRAQLEKFRVELELFYTAPIE